MRVLVDDTAAFHQGAGIGEYARGLIPAAVVAGPAITWDLAVARGRHDPPFAERAREMFPPGADTHWHRFPLSPENATRLWHRLHLPIPASMLARSPRPDVVYSPDLMVPPEGAVPRVPTIHDVAFLVRPDLYPPRLRAWLEGVTRRQVRDAAHLIAVSESTRVDLIEIAGVAPERISVVPNGIDPAFLTASPPDGAMRRRLGIPGEYLLMVGTVEPRKNHLGLFAALERSSGNVDLPLVVAGRRGWGNEAIMAELGVLVERGRVVYLPDVSADDLPALYRGAAATVYPALREGFGRPVVEALAAGSPVVIHDTPSLREAGGDLAIVADAENPDALAIAIGDALLSTQRSEDRRRERRDWAARRTWASSGTALVETLRRVASWRPAG